MTVACFIDMAKAFDTVNHKILCKKLFHLGIKGEIGKLIVNYLNDRKQCTLSNGIISPYHDIVCGVPQGSILGPLLFIVYMNDLQNVCDNSKYLLYADDTVIFNTKEIDQATTEVKSDLSKFKLLCDRNQLTMNVKKTKYVVFGLRSQTKKFTHQELFIQNQKIQRVATYKYLGITLDMNLTFTNHLQIIQNIVSHKCMLLSKLRKYIDTHTAIILYKSMILPIMEYGDVIYGGAKGKHINRLQKIQNRILRTCVYTNEYIETDQLYTMCKTSKLDIRRDVHLKLFMYKQKQNVNIVNMRKINTRAHGALLFTTLKPNNEKYKQNAYYRGALSWNDLPVIERNILDFEKFKAIQKGKLYHIN